MSYNSFSKPRFYTNTLEYLYNKGMVKSIDPIFLSSSWHNPKTYDLYPPTDTWGAYTRNFEVSLSQNGLLYDMNYIMILGHKFNAQDTTFRLFFYDDYDQVGNNTSLRFYTYGITQLSNITEGSWGGNINAWEAPDFDYVPIIITFNPNSSYNGFEQSKISRIRLKIISQTSTTASFSGMVVGNYYDLPYNPDLGIKKSISYDGVNTYNAIGGKTLSSNYGSSKPFNPFANVYSSTKTQELYDRINMFNYPEYIGFQGESQLGSYHGGHGHHIQDELQIAEYSEGYSNFEQYGRSSQTPSEGNKSNTPTDEMAHLSTENHESGLYGDVANMQDHIPTGRKSYDISYSYIGSDSNSQNYSFPRDFNYAHDMSNLSEDLTYNSDKNNLYTSVIHKTNGSHLPFIFSLNGENSNELMLARFKDNNFEFNEVAPSVHNVSFGIREVW